VFLCIRNCFISTLNITVTCEYTGTSDVSLLQILWESANRLIMPSVINGTFAVCCHCIDVIIYSSKLGWSCGLCRYISAHWLGNNSPTILSGLHYFFLVTNFWSKVFKKLIVASKIPYIEWNLKVHFCVHKKLLPVPSLSQLNPVSAITVREFFVWSPLCTSCWDSVWLRVSCDGKYFPMRY